MDAKKRTKVHQSRILREMRNHAEHPFSPPSSTGSHGTVTLTSDISNFMPRDDTHDFPAINTSALVRHFPEWKGLTYGKENKKPEPASPEVANNDVSNSSATSYDNTVIRRRDPAR
ncbi:hypothetical protein F5Y09DRAFT_206465 [Xylaria sp. FL1042]|nr:hypothetical protein F5Y09DRAFT_206465 [Xylaria sp. FL1042]